MFGWENKTCVHTAKLFGQCSVKQYFAGLTKYFCLWSIQVCLKPIYGGVVCVVILVLRKLESNLGTFVDVGSECTLSDRLRPNGLRRYFYHRSWNKHTFFFLKKSRGYLYTFIKEQSQTIIICVCSLMRLIGPVATA